LALPEIKPRESIEAGPGGDSAVDQAAQVHVALVGADFTWERNSEKKSEGDDASKSDGDDVSILSGITMSACAGELVMVIGKVGSGKSSLLAAILGEMEQTAGASRVSEGLKIAYAAQEPWVRSASVRSNIDFSAERSEGGGDESDEGSVYSQVVKASQLLPDMRMLPAGDATMVGERGITLSGGQKARVCFARACHHALSKDADVVLLDDPLSAVDAGVAQGLFEQGVLGLLKSRTVILTLNSHYEYLPMADKVVVMGDGQIIAQGKLSDIIGAVEREFPEMEWAAAGGVGTSKTAAAKTAAAATAAVSNPEEKAPTVEVVVGDAGDGTSGAVSASTATVATAGKDPVVGTELLTVEDRNFGEVSLGTWIDYFGAAFNDSGAYGGPVLLVMVLVIFASAQGGRIVTDLWVARYSRDANPSANGAVAADAITPVVANSTTTAASSSPPDEEQFIAIYLGFGAATCVLAFARLKLFTALALRCSKHLNERTFRAVVRAPVNTFFDVTPMGRIINRFSKVS
jgi:ABC-type multidrug transport system fused ATPase/permease subunit